MESESPQIKPKGNHEQKRLWPTNLQSGRRQYRCREHDFGFLVLNSREPCSFYFPNVEKLMARD